MATTLYYAPGACSLASHIVLAETGIPYEAVKMDLAAGDQRQPDYLRINPRGRVPALVVDGEVLTENVGIMGYLASGHPEAGLWPEHAWDRARLMSTLAWLSNTVHPAYGHIVRPERYAETDAGREDIKARGRASFQGYLEEIERLLAGREWCIGERCTVADPYLLVFYRWANRAGMPVRALPNYTALVQRLLARPAVTKVLADEGITLD